MVHLMLNYQSLLVLKIAGKPVAKSCWVLNLYVPIKILNVFLLEIGYLRANLPKLSFFYQARIKNGIKLSFIITFKLSFILSV